MANGTSGTKSTGGGNASTAAPINNLPLKGDLDPGVVGNLLSDLYPHASSYQEAKTNWIKDHTDVDEGNASKTAAAIGHFTGSESGDIRHAQKNGDTTSSYGKDGVLLEDYITKAPQWDNSRDLHRGMDLSPDTVKGILDGIKSGKNYDINYGGSASWSTKYAVSEGFAGGYGGKVPVIFRTKKMTKATPIGHITSIKGEHEVLSSKDNMFKPIKATKKKINGKDGYLIDVEQI